MSDRCVYMPNVINMCQYVLYVCPKMSKGLFGQTLTHDYDPRHLTVVPRFVHVFGENIAGCAALLHCKWFNAQEKGEVEDWELTMENQWLNFASKWTLHLPSEAFNMDYAKKLVCKVCWTTSSIFTVSMVSISPLLGQSGPYDHHAGHVPFPVGMCWMSITKIWPVSEWYGDKSSKKSNPKIYKVTSTQVLSIHRASPGQHQLTPRWPFLLPRVSCI